MESGGRGEGGILTWVNGDGGGEGILTWQRQCLGGGGGGGGISTVCLNVFELYMDYTHLLVQINCHKSQRLELGMSTYILELV